MMMHIAMAMATTVAIVMMTIVMKSVLFQIMR